jgi:hypothetical protein
LGMKTREEVLDKDGEKEIEEKTQA